MTRLVVLDLNGVLSYKCSLDSVIENSAIIELARAKVVLRPGYAAFLAHCYEHYSVAFFSSTTYTNANPILEKMLTAEQKQQTVFRWFRDRTRLDPDYGTGDVAKFDTIKLVKDIIENPTVNESRVYSYENVLLIDDDLNKVRLNNPKNVMTVGSYYGKREDTTLAEIIPLIEAKFAQME